MRALRTLDIGWFAKDAPFAYARPDPPRFAAGGEGWLESTPPILPLYQSRAGHHLALALGPARSRAYSLRQLVQLKALLKERNIEAWGGDDAHGAFIVVPHAHATDVAKALRRRGVVGDARGSYLRLCPDILTTGAELERAAAEVARCITDACAPR